MPQFVLSVLTFLLGVSYSLYVAGYSISGKLVSENEPVAFAHIAIPMLDIGTTSDEQGVFLLEEVPAGKHKVYFSAVGYQTLMKDVILEPSQTNHMGTIELMQDMLGLDEVVVTGTMRETYVRASPIKVDVVTSTYLEKSISPVNLTESVKLINGVDEVVACGVCYTSNISINGLPGQYTAVLMDGMPIYGNLASVYGLNGIPTSIISRIEVIKGPSSTLYGSEAMAGVINIITKKPDEQELVQVNIMGSSHMESFGNLAWNPKLGKWNATIGLNYGYMNDYADFNQDGFGDMVQLDQLAGFTKWDLKRPEGKIFSMAGKVYWEDRRNGTQTYLNQRAYRSLRGSNEIYGESIYTKRAEVFGKYELPLATKVFWDYSASMHQQDSYYGSDQYVAEQYILFSNAYLEQNWKNHRATLGLSARYQYYDDNTVATGDSIDSQIINQPENQFIPGVFLQDEWEPSVKFNLLSGIRFDYYQAHGLIFSPRIGLKYLLGPFTTARLNLGSGFKTVQLFTEDHAFISGQREVVIQSELNPETSSNLTLNLNHVYLLGKGQGMVDLSFFYTHFNNKITPNYDTPGKIIYDNTVGDATNMGFGLNIDHQFSFPIAIKWGATIMRTMQDKLEEQEIVKDWVEFAPLWSSLISINYNWKKPQLLWAFTANVTGPMALPQVYDLNDNGVPVSLSRPTTSSPFSICNFQVTKVFNTGIQLYLGVQNIFNYRQAYSPLIGYNDPNADPGFSEYFDTSYTYSPIHGREVILGFRWSIE